MRQFEKGLRFPTSRYQFRRFIVEHMAGLVSDLNLRNK